jgi:hypothetical protein
VGDIRAALRADANEQYARIAAFFDDALDATREVRGKCATCGSAVAVKAPDWTARTNALKLMIEAGFGRPPADEQRIERITEVEGISWPDVRAMSLAELEALKLALLLQHPHLVEEVLSKPPASKTLVDEHGEDAVEKLVRLAAERDRETRRNLVAVVEEFA